jgi:tRNA pseudouridine38-40 synthase
MPRRRYALRLAYEGGRFRGFQHQPGLPTVQAALREALHACGITAALAVAARTDAGVHAIGQVVSFATSTAFEPIELRRALNAALPEGILCLDARSVPSSFHARASALSRRYVYLLGSPPPAGLEPYAWALPDPRAFPGTVSARLDVAAMADALSSAIGSHDFAGFARRGAQVETVRELLRADVISASSEPLVAIVFEGRGFLRAMVRNLVGTAAAVGLGLKPRAAVAEILERPGRYTGVRAPGWGLTLAAVAYPTALWGE